MSEHAPGLTPECAFRKRQHVASCVGTQSCKYRAFEKHFVLPSYLARRVNRGETSSPPRDCLILTTIDWVREKLPRRSRLLGARTGMTSDQSTDVPRRRRRSISPCGSIDDRRHISPSSPDRSRFQLAQHREITSTIALRNPAVRRCPGGPTCGAEQNRRWRVGHEGYI